jgi:hypothetical protein
MQSIFLEETSKTFARTLSADGLLNILEKKWTRLNQVTKSTMKLFSIGLNRWVTPIYAWKEVQMLIKMDNKTPSINYSKCRWEPWQAWDRK